MKSNKKNEISEFIDTLYVHILTNIGNIFLSITLAMGGLAVSYFQEYLPFGAGFNRYLGLSIVIIAMILLGMVLIHGILKTVDIWGARKKTWKNIVIIPLAAIYLVTGLALFQATVMVSAESLPKKDKTKLLQHAPHNKKDITH